MSIQPINTQASLLESMSQIKASAGIEDNPLSSGQSSKVDFSDVLHQVVRGIDDQQHIAANKAAAVETGQSDDLVGAMIAREKAGLSFIFAMETRNRLMSGFQDIMRTPV